MQQQGSRSPSLRSSLLALGVVALAGSLINRTLRLHSHATLNEVEACRSLPGLPGQLCSSYHGLSGPERFTAAVHWRQLSPSTCKRGLSVLNYVLPATNSNVPLGLAHGPDPCQQQQPHGPNYQIPAAAQQLGTPSASWIRLIVYSSKSAMCCTAC